MKKRLFLQMAALMVFVHLNAQEKTGLFKTKFGDKDPWPNNLGYMYMAGFTTGQNFHSEVPYKTFAVHMAISTHFSLLSMLQENHVFMISDYEIVSLAAGFGKTDKNSWGRGTSLLAGFELGAGAQALLRLNKQIDLGGKLFYGGLTNTGRSNIIEQGWYIGPKVRFQQMYLEYTTNFLPKEDPWNNYDPLHMIQINHIKQETGKLLGLKIEYGAGEGANFVDFKPLVSKRNSLVVQFCFRGSLY